MRGLPFSILACIAAPATAQTFVDAERDGLVAVLPRPPADDSLAGRADLDTVLAFQATRSPAQEAEARADADMAAPDWARLHLRPDFTPERFPLAFRLFDEARRDMTRVIDAAKDKGPQRRRPQFVDGRIRPSLPLGGHHANSWPSARTAATRIWAEVLADIFPDAAPRLRSAAERSAWLRVLGGVHYPTDLVAGRVLADTFLQGLRAKPDYRTRLAQAKAEVASR